MIAKFHVLSRVQTNKLIEYIATTFMPTVITDAWMYNKTYRTELYE